MSDRIKQESSYDVLTDVLQTLRFRGSIFFSSDLAAPWGMSLGSEGLPRFHIALSGQCFVGSDEAETVEVKSGEIVLLPGGGAHWIADKPGRDLVSSARAGHACELGNPLFQEGEITNRIMCGLVHFDQESPHPILNSLPKIVHFGDLEPTASIWSTITLIHDETLRLQHNSSPIIDRLTEVMFLQLLDHYASKNIESAGFLGALRDRRIHQALSLIHQQPAYEWSLDALGERVGMSRATLVRHFQNAVGVSPMTYIANWRLMKAYNLIKYTFTPLEQIAETVGFASAKTLGKAFYRFYDCTPTELRQTQGES